MGNSVGNPLMKRFIDFGKTGCSGEPVGEETEKVRATGERAAALSHLYASLDGKALGDRALATAKLGFSDIVGCIVAGAATPTADMIRAFAAEQASVAPPRATVLATQTTLPPAMAALANAVAGHVLDYDDMNSTMIGHPSVVLVPTILALAEAHGRSGRDVLDAYVTGFEVDTWFARLLVPFHYNAGWHSTSSIGIFGATAAAARLLGLDRSGFLNALAIAASSSAGLRGNFGSMTKSLHAGYAAEGAVRAAMLAARGFTGNLGVFDDAGGYFDAYGRNAEPKPAPPEGRLEIESSGLGIKPYACCGAGISAIDAALDLRQAHSVDAADIASVECAVTTLADSIMPFRAAADGLQAKYCIEYCVSVALLDGKAGLAQFDDARVRRQDVIEMARRVRMIVDPKLRFDANRFEVRLQATLKDGRAVSAHVELPRGHALRPISQGQQLEKFLECCTPVLGKARAKAAFARLQALEIQEDLGPLIGELRA